MKVFMAADQSTPVAEPVSADGGPTETISQFVARVLDQLSLSAWLPAAALLLLLDFIVQLGVALDARGKGSAWVVGDALTRMSAIGIGGAVLLVIAVVVVTILTQAFSFEAIRVLEGYWGTTNAVESIAQWRASRHRSRKGKLDRRRRKLTEDAWAVAKTKISEMEGWPSAEWAAA